MTLISNAQNFEDVLLWRALRDVDKGCYIDVGAQDPVVDSVSHSFYAAGWRGLHVEATAFYANSLRQARPDEIVVEAAVTDVEGVLPFYEIQGTGISTGDASIAANHREHGYQSQLIHVPTVRLDALFDLVEGDVHWLKVDVEGMEAQVLRSWGVHPKRPWLLVVESTYPNSQEPTQHLWIDEVLQRGYGEVFFDGLSRYFVHESHHELRIHLAVPANVFDGFAVPREHFSAGLLRHELEVLEGRLSETQSARQALEGRLAESQAQSAASQAQSAAELSDAQAMTETARRERETTLERLAAVEDHYRTQVVAVWQQVLARQEATRLEFRVREDKLVESLVAASASESAARIDAARLEERSVHLKAQKDLLRETLDKASASERDARNEVVLFQERAQATQARLVAAEQNAAALRLDIERLGRGLAHHRGLALTADALLRRIRDEAPGRWYRIGQVLGVQPTSPARNQLSEWLLPSQPPGLDHFSPISALPIETEHNVQEPVRDDRRNPYLRANSIGELLSWSDVDFVRCAYVTVLGRQPDRSGEAHYAQQIRAGVSKLDVLWRLRRSAEASRHDPGIAGFDRALKRAAWQRRPILGAVARLFRSDADGNSRNDRALRSVINTASVNQSYLRSIHSKLSALGWSSSEPHETFSPEPDFNPSPEPVTAEAATVPDTLQLPELRHLRNQTPLARLVHENAL